MIFQAKFSISFLNPLLVKPLWNYPIPLFSKEVSLCTFLTEREEV